MQVPILSGVRAAISADLKRSYPINLLPIAEAGDGTGTGISKGYLKTVSGVRTMAATKLDRGGIWWNDRHLRVLGEQLSVVDAADAVTTLGDVGNDGAPVRFAASFDRLGIASAGKLFYLAGDMLTEVTDPDLGPVVSLTWQDGYFITTDGTSLVATDLSDPTSIDPLRYGSSEADPDPVVGVLSLRGELYAINQTTIEVFANSGGSGFPFQRQRGAQIPKGAAGPYAFAPFVETFAFVGSARNEAPAAYLAGSGQAIRISPRALDQELGDLTPTQLAETEVEARQVDGVTLLLIHLPWGSWVYNWTASQMFDTPVWSRMQGAQGRYPVRHWTLVGDQWWCGGSSAIGKEDDSIVTVLDQELAFEFDTPVIYSEGAGAIVHDLELITIGGRGAASAVLMAYSDDGLVYSVERSSRTGALGDRFARPAWRRCGRMRNWRSFRFRGVASSPTAFMRLEARLEATSG